MSEHHTPAPENPRLSSEVFTAGYEVIEQLPEELTLQDGFMRTDDGEYVVFRRQRSLDTPFNTLPGKPLNAGLYGNVLGFANTEAALRGASGHVDASTFKYNVIYKVPELDIIDLRPSTKATPLGLRALAASVSLAGGFPGVTDRRFDRIIKDHDGFITNRTLAQGVLVPFASASERSTDNEKLHIRPAWLALRPEQSLTMIAYKNRKEQ